jgi:hypothetical protein
MKPFIFSCSFFINPADHIAKASINKRRSDQPGSGVEKIPNPGSRVEKIPDPGSESASKNSSIFNPTFVT